MTHQHEDQCPIWPGCPASVRYHPSWEPAYQVDSPRAGGEYDISVLAAEYLKGGDFDEVFRAQLTTQLINHKKQNGQPMQVTEDVLWNVRSAGLLPLDDRTKRLLQYLAQCSELGQEVVLFSGLSSPHMAEHGYGALAWSESTTLSQLKSLCDDLIEERQLRHSRDPGTAYSVEVTVKGYKAVREPHVSTSNKAFVAMWLHKSMDKVFERGIRPGIEDAGYKAIRIDRQPDVDKIDDAILEEIRQCRFMVADFTHGESGARGSVYFEVGFAFGLGIDVFFTCRTEQLDRIHFDTRQHYHIGWEYNDLDDLRQQLAKRIHARIGLAQTPAT